MPSVSRFMTYEARCVSPDDSLARVRELMTQYGIRHVPVRDGETLVGIIHERDISIVLSVPGARLEQITAKSVANPATYVWSDTPLNEVAELMTSTKCDAVVVRGGQGIEGIFTSTDALRALRDVLKRAAV